MAISLGHVFIFVDHRDAALSALADCGLSQSYGRAQRGQGTANVVACFDNACLEILWADDTAEMQAVPVSRTRLAERARWRDTGACPFGIGLTGGMPFPYWDYRSPALPAGTSLSVALASEDPRQPFLFRCLNEARPDTWTDGLSGNRQKMAGLTEIIGVHLDLPAGASPSLHTLADRGILTLKKAVTPRLLLSVAAADGGHKVLSLPDFAWID